ncbi:hypothetical protein FFI16_012920 [Pseudomonas sp. KBS0710]|uniref:hypothetical protein n=1 Tax=Pseudomonas sp. KBS0710 TaxID=1179667 RepID=UPI00110F03AB|nr:hypothetical protein [Pseudomonas sp. KBS0710]TSD77281.1 hypothetical protein FFI16_012920 [Pseudomonas sp. KBS0710]
MHIGGFNAKSVQGNFEMSEMLGRSKSLEMSDAKQFDPAQKPEVNEQFAKDLSAQVQTWSVSRGGSDLLPGAGSKKISF